MSLINMIFLFILFSWILYKIFFNNSAPAATITNIVFDQTGSYDDGYPATITWESNSGGPFTILANASSTTCTNGTLVTDEGTCWYNFNISRDGIWSTATGKVYNRTGAQMTFTINGPNCSGFVNANVSCILESCIIKTLQGPKQAKLITIDDYLTQLDGSYKKVKSIKHSFYDDYLYKSKNAYVTEWHPVKFFAEKDYVVAKEHTKLEKIYMGIVSVYHFELENQTDDILFENDDLIAESWNDLNHGEVVVR